VTMQPATAPRVLMVSSMYRPDWQAEDEAGGDLPTYAVARALLGVTVPPGTTTVVLAYRPVARWIMAWLGMLGFAGLLVVAVRRPRKVGAV